MRSFLRIALVAIVATCVLGVAESRATVLISTNNETATTFTLVGLWTGPATDILDLTLAPIGFLNWSGTLTIGLSSSTGELGVIGGNLTHVLGAGPSLNIVAAPLLVGVNGPYVAFAAHGGAIDKYMLTVERFSTNPDTAKFTLTGAHIVPEPSTALLGLAGLGLLAGARLIRRRAH